MPTLVTDAVRVEYSESGRGEPVVLVHSAPGTAGQWRTLAEALKDTYRVLAVNLHGIGETQPWPGPGHMGIDDDARLVRAVGMASGAPFHIVGHSYGGAVAIRVALSSPAQVQSLTLIEPMVYALLRWAGDLSAIGHRAQPPDRHPSPLSWNLVPDDRRGKRGHEPGGRAIATLPTPSATGWVRNTTLASRPA